MTERIVKLSKTTVWNGPKISEGGRLWRRRENPVNPLKVASESVKFPDLYYENNVGSLENILECLKSKPEKKFNLIFSSSCTVYGQAKKLPITEDSPVLNQESPYGETKKKVYTIKFTSINN